MDDGLVVVLLGGPRTMDGCWPGHSGQNATLKTVTRNHQLPPSYNEVKRSGISQWSSGRIGINYVFGHQAYDKSDNQKRPLKTTKMPFYPAAGGHSPPFRQTFMPALNHASTTA
jgi:hypothetical protein